MSTIPIGTNTFKAKRLIYVFLILGVFMLAILTNYHSNKKMSFLVLSAAALPFLFAFLSWLSTKRFYLVIDDSGITDKHLFKKTHLTWSEITSIEHKFEWHNKSGYNKIIIYSKDPQNTLHIHSDYYPRKVLKTIAELLVAKVNNQCSDKIKNMAEGKFPWYVF